MAATFDKVRCGACTQYLKEGEGAFIRVKGCKHMHHAACFYRPGYIEKVGKTMLRVLCPDKACKGQVVYMKRMNEEAITEGDEKGVEKELHKKIERLEFSDGASMAKGLKYVSYITIAMTVAIVAVVIHTSFIAIGVGLVVAVPIGYLVGKRIEAYLLPKAGSPSA